MKKNVWDNWSDDVWIMLILSITIIIVFFIIAFMSVACVNGGVA